MTLSIVLAVDSIRWCFGTCVMSGLMFTDRDRFSNFGFHSRVIYIAGDTADVLHRRSGNVTNAGPRLDAAEQDLNWPCKYINQYQYLRRRLDVVDTSLSSLGRDNNRKCYSSDWNAPSERCSCVHGYCSVS